MYKVSVVGIDNTCKTSIVRSLVDSGRVDTIHLTAYSNHTSRIAGFSWDAVNGLALWGERERLKSITGFAYLLHLFPYLFEKRARRSSHILVSDRDPVIDTLCYSDFYLPDGFSEIVRPPLKFTLEHVFGYPDSLIYLEASPEVSASRNKKPVQLHDPVASLYRIREIFDEEIFRVKREGIPVFNINTDIKPIEEVTAEVKHYLKNLRR